MKPFIKLATRVALLSTWAGVASAALLTNGSLEDLAGNWSNTTCNYMALAPGSTAIQGWTVSTGGSGPLVWAREPTCDGFSAPDGEHFVDLSGFGTSAGLGAALEQWMTGLVTGETYTVSLSYLGALPGVHVDGVGLSGVGGSASWTSWSGSFVAGGSTALLSLRNRPSGGFVFVDDVRVSGPSAGPPGAVPAPGSAALAGLALGLLALAPLNARRRR